MSITNTNLYCLDVEDYSTTPDKGLFDFESDHHQMVDVAIFEFDYVPIENATELCVVGVRNLFLLPNTLSKNSHYSRYTENERKPRFIQKWSIGTLEGQGFRYLKEIYEVFNKNKGSIVIKNQ